MLNSLGAQSLKTLRGGKEYGAGMAILYLGFLPFLEKLGS
jgi:hypothetical protein